jgi:hypothetical protein
MSSGKHLRKNLARLRQARETLENSLKQATGAAGAKSSGRRNINVATRVNKAVATNSGEPDTIRGASSTQSVKITQGPGGTEEVSESTNVQISSGGHT